MDIDIVLLWVDGADPAWLAEKRSYQPPEEAGSDSANRYRDWGLLPYWFRLVDRFMPWVRKIHFVTWGHVPGFLNLECEKLHVVKHRDFIPKEYLPTFSSHTIEMNIHRIEGLAEHFVYFNDDMFLLRPMEETDFFREGLPCTYGAEEPWAFVGVPGIWAHAAANDLGIINRHFSKKEAMAKHGRKYLDKAYPWKCNLRTWMVEKLYPDYFLGFRNLHAPAAYRKQTFREVWEAEPELLDSTCRDRFRRAGNVNQWLCLWWQIAGGNFAPYVVDNAVESICEERIDRLCGIITGQTHDYICLNDLEENVPFEALSTALQEAFSALLPEKCRFEK